MLAKSPAQLIMKTKPDCDIVNSLCSTSFVCFLHFDSWCDKIKPAKHRGDGRPWFVESIAADVPTSHLVEWDSSSSVHKHKTENGHVSIYFPFLSAQWLNCLHPGLAAYRLPLSKLAWWQMNIGYFDAHKKEDCWSDKMKIKNKIKSKHLKG